MSRFNTLYHQTTSQPQLKKQDKIVFLSHCIDLFDESACESAEENPLHLDELKSPLSSLFQSSSNPFELPKQTKTSVHSQPWEGFCLTTIEDPKKVKVVNPNPHSTICNPEPNPSFVLDKPNLQSQPVHSPDICPSPDDPHQDVDKSHLRKSTSTTTNLNETCSLDTSCDHLLHLDSPSLSSELQETSSVESVEIEFVPDFEEPLESNNFSPIDVFSVQHDYDLFLLNQEIDTPSDNLNHQNTHVCEKQGQDDFLIHATDLSHNFALPNPWHNTMVKT